MSTFSNTTVLFPFIYGMSNIAITVVLIYYFWSGVLNSIKPTLVTSLGQRSSHFVSNKGLSCLYSSRVFPAFSLFLSVSPTYNPYPQCLVKLPQRLALFGLLLSFSFDTLAYTTTIIIIIIGYINTE